MRCFVVRNDGLDPVQGKLLPAQRKSTHAQTHITLQCCIKQLNGKQFCGFYKCRCGLEYKILPTSKGIICTVYIYLIFGLCLEHFWQTLNTQIKQKMTIRKKERVKRKFLEAEYFTSFFACLFSLPTISSVEEIQAKTEEIQPFSNLLPIETL